MDHSLIYFGDSVKALDDNGKIGGYLVRYSDEANPMKDLDGEYFVKSTHLGARSGDGVDTVFHHSQPIPVKVKLSAKAVKEMEALRDHLFAPIKTRQDAIGVWAETVLDLADEYEKVVFGIVKSGKLGWSSGAVSHLVRKESDGKITRWPIGEASLTPTPAEPLNRAIPISSLKSVKFVSWAGAETPEEETEDEFIKISPERQNALAAKLNRHIDDLTEDGRSAAQIIKRMAQEADIEVKTVEEILSGTLRPSDARLRAFARVLDINFDSLKAIADKGQELTIKGIFEDAVADKQFSTWQLWDIYSKVVKKLANIAESSAATGVKFDLKGKLAEVNAEYITRLNNVVLTQIADWIESEDDDPFYLKSLTAPEGNLLAELAIDLDDHAQLVVSAIQGTLKRFKLNHEARLKAGRMLSEKNRKRLAALIGQMTDVMTDMQKLMDESKPMADDAEKTAAISQTLRLQWRTRQLGASAHA